MILSHPCTICKGNIIKTYPDHATRCETRNLPKLQLFCPYVCRCLLVLERMRICPKRATAIFLARSCHPSTVREDWHVEAPLICTYANINKHGHTHTHAHCTNLCLIMCAYRFRFAERTCHFIYYCESQPERYS